MKFILKKTKPAPVRSIPSPSRLVNTVISPALKDLELLKKITNKKDLKPSPSHPKNKLKKPGLKISKIIDITNVNKIKWKRR